jgi:hypothetical protein
MTVFRFPAGNDIRTGPAAHLPCCALSTCVLYCGAKGPSTTDAENTWKCTYLPPCCLLSVNSLTDISLCVNLYIDI